MLIGVFRKIAHLIPMNMKRSLFFSMFQSLILYCIPIYGATTNENSFKIQGRQNRALKGLFNKEPRYSTIQLHRELKVLPFIETYVLYSCKHIQSIKFGRIHSNIELINANNVHDYPTRTCNNIRLQRIRTATWGSNNPLRHASDAYNSIDVSVKSKVDPRIFKTKLKTLLLTSL